MSADANAKAVDNPYARKEVSYSCETGDEICKVVGGIFKKVREARELGERNGNEHGGELDYVLLRYCVMMLLIVLTVLIGSLVSCRALVACSRLVLGCLGLKKVGILELTPFLCTLLSFRNLTSNQRGSHSQLCRIG